MTYKTRKGHFIKYQDPSRNFWKQLLRWLVAEPPDPVEAAPTRESVEAGEPVTLEATVLDGLPLFAFLTQLRHTGIRRIRGVLNATSSVVLESVAHGSTRSRGLARAQAQGIAEADSVLDLDGWDAAAKSALLANVWMGGALRVVDVARTGIDVLKDNEIKRAQEAGAKFRMLAEIERSDDGHIRASVEPFALEGGDPLYALRGGQGGVVVHTDQGHEQALLQQTHGLDDAAYGVMQDGWAIVYQAPTI